MNSKRVVKISKFLSLVLRHQPELIGIALDTAGWVLVSELLSALNVHGHPLSLEELRAVVSSNDKQRFSLSEDGTRIRANQGHSVEVELAYQHTAPPEVLYHGTAERSLPSIKQHGLLKDRRHHVHLSRDFDIALKVGRRHGRPLVLQVQSGRMHKDGYVFYESANGVWLTEHVPTVYLML